MVLPKPNFSYTTYVNIESLPIFGVPILVLILGSLFTCIGEKCHKNPKDTFLDIFYGPPLAVLTNTAERKKKKKSSILASMRYHVVFLGVCIL